jgi:hypothetical protein
LVINGAVGILYNTFIVNGDQERVWVRPSVVRVSVEKVLYPAKPSKKKECCRFGTFRVWTQILSRWGEESTSFDIGFYIGAGG